MVHKYFFRCHGSDFLFPPGSLRFDVETHANQNLSISGEHLPFAVADPNLGAMALNKEQVAEIKLIMIK